MILVDSNVLIDIVDKQPEWMDWSANQLRMARLRDSLAINPIIYAEISMMYDTCEQVNAVLAKVGIEVMPLKNEAALLAGHVFKQYRERAKQQAKSSVLPDFFIGAQAQTEGWVILTRDIKRYKTYFPKLTLIAPLQDDKAKG